MNDMNPETVYRVFHRLIAALNFHAITRKQDSHSYEEMNHIKHRISATVDVLNDNELSFLEWATRTTQDAYGYGYENYGLKYGKEYPQCYPNASKFLKEMTDNDIVFNYVFDEYGAMKNAEKSQRIIDERESRTCPNCETRFDTHNGMHRHRPKCKGVYRGEYHTKGIPKYQTTSAW